jgi:hypothetical protein
MRSRLVGGAALILGAFVLLGISITSGSDDDSRADGTDASASSAPTNYHSSDENLPMPEDTDQQAVLDEHRLLYSPADIARYRLSMSGVGPYFTVGDAGHGGPHSPDDGERSVKLATDFLSNPQESYWIQPDLPFTEGDPWPDDMAYVRPMHAAWVYMTVPGHPNRDDLQSEVKALLLHHAKHPSHDFSNPEHYTINYPGYVPSPIFSHSAWVTRLIKARDMLGREGFTESENETLDQWLFDYANWAFKWLHHEAYVKIFPGRELRDYSRINRSADASRRSYDGGPLIGSLAMAYTNRHAAVASTASLAANYLKFHGFVAPVSGGPPYGRFSIDELLLHSRLFVEETIRFSVYPEGLQGDFERGDLSVHATATPQLGWSYSSNVLANLVEIAEYHGRRGDMSVWDYETIAGFDGTAGAPTAGGFERKNLHFYAWSMSRYVSNGWNRTNYGEPLALPHFYHDVIPAATVARFAPSDPLLHDAWRRDGSGFPPYPEQPQSQGMWDARYGEGAKVIGLIEQANGSAYSSERSGA